MEASFSYLFRSTKVRDFRDTPRHPVTLLMHIVLHITCVIRQRDNQRKLDKVDRSTRNPCRFSPIEGDHPLAIKKMTVSTSRAYRCDKLFSLIGIIKELYTLRCMLQKTEGKKRDKKIKNYMVQESMIQ